MSYNTLASAYVKTQPTNALHVYIRQEAHAFMHTPHHTAIFALHCRYIKII